jgi:hydrogenase maturation protease
VLILGYGNPDRGDDAAGSLTVLKLRELGIPAEDFRGDGLDLLETWGASADVVVIDAMVSGGEPGSIRAWEDPARSMEGGYRLCSTHGIGIAEAVRLGTVIGRLPARLRIYGIEGSRFEVGVAPSPAVIRAAVELATRLADELRLFPMSNHLKR